MALSRKFHGQDHYTNAHINGYQLLPFNFHRLPSRQYLMVNLVGEYLIVDREVIVKLVAGKIKPSSEIYNDLKSKHFLMDKNNSVAPDLLALKYRTKQHAVSQFTSLHMFVVTLRCDYTCKYCQVSRRMEGDGSFDMTEKTALKSLDLVFKTPSQSIKIEFQGGEPLLNFGLIKFVVSEVLRRNIHENKYIQFVITTNLTFLTDEVVRFCDEHNIFISTSLDGKKDLHDKNRPRPGKDGYQRTIAGIKKVQRELGQDKVSALMTTTAESLSSPRELIDEYVEQGLHTIFLRPLSPYGFALKTKQAQKYNVDNWMKFYREGLEYIIELNRAGYYLREQYASIILKKILEPTNPGYVDLQSPAGMGISAVVYNYDGDVYAGDEARMLKEMGDDHFKLGSVHDDKYEDIFLSDVLLDSLEDSIAESAPMCSDCGLLPYCGSDPTYHYTTQGDVVGKKPLSFFCNKNMSVMEHVFSILEDEESKKILESWI